MLVFLSSVTTQYFIAYNGITTPIDYWLQRAERVQIHVSLFMNANPNPHPDPNR